MILKEYDSRYYVFGNGKPYWENDYYLKVLYPNGQILNIGFPVGNQMTLKLKQYHAGEWVRLGNMDQEPWAKTIKPVAGPKDLMSNFVVYRNSYWILYGKGYTVLYGLPEYQTNSIGTNVV